MSQANYGTFATSSCPHSVLMLEYVPERPDPVYRCTACKFEMTGIPELNRWQDHVADLNHLRRALAKIKEHREGWKVTRWALPEGWTEDGAAGYRMAMDWVLETLDPMTFLEEQASAQETPGETSS